MEGSFFAALGNWNWFLAAGLLLLLELALPGTFMLWLGLAAAATGAIAFAVPLGWQAGLAVFAVFSVGFVLLGRSIMRRGGDKQVDQPFLNQRGEALVGQEFVLIDPIVAGAGRVRVGDSVWRVTGPDMSSGKRVRVARVDGSVLVVEPV
jgi:membrane protein implicated in regulation of membrane protease activity